MNVSKEPLMAKSRDKRFREDELTVSGHCQRVGRAARAIAQNLEVALQQCFLLKDPSTWEKQSRIYELAGYLHDLGKVSCSFQEMIAGTYKNKHPFFHEILSAALIGANTELQQWLAESVSKADLSLTAVTIAAHHLRADEQISNPRVQREVTLYLEHNSLLDLWKAIGSKLGINPPSKFSNLTMTPREASSFVANFLWDAEDVMEVACQDQLTSLSVVKGLLICADIVGSSKTENNQSLEEWVSIALNNRLKPGELSGVVTSRLGQNDPYPFQQKVAESKEKVTLVTAGCGNGKTLAAYLWAQRHAENRKLVFCYPTTGTTSAGFADYLLAQSQLERTLLHSRAAADIEALQTVPNANADYALWAKDALDLWGCKVIACTVDSVLGFLSNWRRSLASLPVWVQSAFVFDEIHSYDRNLFGALLAFLRKVKAPCLLMTASLTKARLQALEEAIGKKLEPIQGNPKIEKSPRYQITLSNQKKAKEAIQSTLAKGGKVLWVVNTVGRAQEYYEELRSFAPQNRCWLYHSRFRYIDRVHRQQQVIDAFRDQQAALVISTQVCEMSLDISADLLVTELAPFPALIQRLGRLNRRDAFPQHTKPCHIIDPEHVLPYNKQTLDEASELIKKLANSETSQADLAKILSDLHEETYEIRNMPFFHRTVYTQPGTLREPSYNLTLVRDEDLQSFGEKPKRADLINMEIPMNQNKQYNPNKWGRVRGVPIAPAGTVEYSVEVGASWAK